MTVFRSPAPGWVQYPGNDRATAAIVAHFSLQTRRRRFLDAFEKDSLGIDVV